MLKKCFTGIVGLDEITEGGVPKNRPTLICGGPGSGKTLLSMQFLINGAMLYREPGLFISFEEQESELKTNVASMGFDLGSLFKQKLIILDHIEVENTSFETGEYNLEGIFIRIGDAIQRFKIKRIVLDTIEVLFSHLSNNALIRSELQRLFRWLKQKKVTALITCEKGKGFLSRYGLEEYVADCVIFLDHRIENQRSTRRLRIIKYRGSAHGSNEYPFLVDKDGISLAPITSIRLDYQVPKTFISTGIQRLDHMLGGKGYYKGSSVLISGASGAGKSSFAATFADSVCKKGGKALYFAFEESLWQIVRNMESLGMNLQKWLQKKKLNVQCIRPTHYGLEMHLKVMIDAIEKFKPEVVIVDPMSNLKWIALPVEVKDMLSRLIDHLKKQQITTLLTSLMTANMSVETQEAVSSLMDTWIILNYIENKGERSRVINISKSRGMDHSNQAREIIISERGIDLADVYTGTGEVLAGAARQVQLMKENIESLKFENEYKIKKLNLEYQHKLMKGKINDLNMESERIIAEIKSMEEQKTEIEEVESKGQIYRGQMKMKDLKDKLLQAKGNEKKSKRGK